MSNSMKKLLLLAKKETVVGTDSVPTAGANAILCRAFTPKPIEADLVDRQLIRPYKGNSGKLVASVHREMDFEVELAGSGDPGTAPGFGLLLEACGCVELIVADTSVSYTAGENEVTLTLYGYTDKVLWKMMGSKGTFSLEANAKGIPVLKFHFIGEYSEPTDVTLPTGVDYGKFIKPLVVGKRNTPAFTMLGQTVCTSGFTVDMANALTYRDLINCGGPSSPDRTPVGTAVFELTTVAAKNWGAALNTAAEGLVHMTHGSVPGNIVQIDLPAAQLNKIDLTDQDSIAMLSVGFDVNPVLGDDEIVLTFL